MSNIPTNLDFIRPDYLQTNPHTTAERKAFLRGLWRAIAPEIELQYGVYNSTVAAPTAIFSQAIIDSIDKWRQHTQIAQLIGDVTEGTTNYEYLELFLENYRIRRKAGQRSVGLVRLTFNQDSAYAFAMYETFTANGLTFRPTRVFSIQPTSRTTYQPDSEQVLQRMDDGTYTAVIELRSDVVSLAANLTAGTQLIMPERVVSQLIGVTVIESFVGGVEEDRLVNLVPRLVEGITSPVMTSRSNIAAQLKTLDVGVKEVSVIGAGDIESVRDKHGLFNISQGGRGDVYVRTSGQLMTKEIVATGVRQENSRLFKIQLGRDDAPAAYTIRQVRRREGSEGLNILHESRSIDLSGVPYAPDVINYREGAFSRYQTIMLLFEDENAHYDQEEYLISYDYQPGIPELQEHCISQSNVAVMGDILVKAAIPCRTSLSFSVAVQQGQTAPDTASLAAAATNFINSTGFMNVLPGAAVIEVVQRALPAGMFVSDFIMTGDLVMPELIEGDGAVVRLRRTAGAAKEELLFDLPPYATANTICFFADVNDVHIDIKHHQSVGRLIT